MMWGYGFNGGAWMWAIGGLVVIGVVVLVVVLIRNSTAVTTRAGTTAAAMTSTPRQILDERYSRGELTTEEYRERVETLGGKP